MATISITTTYDTETRELRSAVALTGFVAAIPTQISAGLIVETPDIANDAVLSSADCAALMISARRALDVANYDLVEWQKVAANPEKAVAYVAATTPPEPEEPEEPEPEPAP